MSILSIVIMYPAGNLEAVDAYFFGASASTESGLNTVDVSALYTYQQVYLYLAPMLTNLGFINAVVVAYRFYWFRKHLSKKALELPQLQNHPSRRAQDPETGHHLSNDKTTQMGKDISTTEGVANAEEVADTEARQRTIAFDTSAEAGNHPKNNETLYIPGPRDRDRGLPVLPVDKLRPHDSQDDLSITVAPASQVTGGNADLRRRRHANGPHLGETRSLDRVTSMASSLFVIGNDPRQSQDEEGRRRRRSTSCHRELALDTLNLSRTATVGRNSDFRNLTAQDYERLGGIEYRSLKLLLKVVFPYFFGLHMFGAICLIPWIHRAAPKYKQVLQDAGQGETWWAFYSAQTMVDNLGFTLTPDSMISFRDAEWPIFVMTFLAFAGNTLYPVFMRLLIWTISKVVPQTSSLQEPLAFLLNHPRRCYTLLFPRGPTWILFAIIFVLNFIDTLLIIVLDLHNPEVASLPVGPRILAALFQACSSRHTGTAIFNLANVNPAVQFSLLVMMYIAVFPIAVVVRASNTYEEKSLGIYETERDLDEDKGKSYLLTHMRNQLSFDLWFIFLGTFCICIAEADRIRDNDIPSFTVWTVLFEVTSAYGNVGLSLGYPTVYTSLSGVFTTFSKLIICVCMIRGRHRGLPYAIDRAIMLPDKRELRGDAVDSKLGNDIDQDQ